MAEQTALQKLKHNVSGVTIAAALALAAAMPGVAEAQTFTKQNCARMGQDVGRTAGQYAAAGKSEARALAAVLGGLIGTVTGNAICNDDDQRQQPVRQAQARPNYRR